MAGRIGTQSGYAINTVSQPADKKSADDVSNLAAQASNKIDKVTNNGSGSSFSSKEIRNATNKIIQGAGKIEPRKVPDTKFLSAAQNGEAIEIKQDWRIRISLGNNATIFYNDDNNRLMQPLKETNGVIFPYTPDIVVTHAANYNSASPTHSNYAQQFYNDSQVSDIVVTGEFTAQNVYEGQYLMAAIQFFRAATKMFFGQGANVGNPPPVVFLNGYGNLYFPNVPCVISNFTQRMQNDVDYIEVPITTGTKVTQINEARTLEESRKGGGSVDWREVVEDIRESVRVPTVTQFTVILRPVYSRKNLHDNFNLNDFAAGKLLGKDNSGGFL